MKNKTYILQIGLAFPLLYAGINAFLFPYDWIGFVPSWTASFGASREFALHAHSLVEIILGLWLLSTWKIRWAGLLAALDIIVIILSSGFDRTVFLATFRDVGLAAIGLYLFFAD